MKNPIVSGIVYLAELLVIYVFYCRITEKKVSVWQSLLIRLLLFEFGSAGNILFQNNVMVNTSISLVIYLLFAILYFEIRPLSVIFYSALLVAANFTLEILVILMYSPFTSGISIDMNRNPVLLLLAAVTAKTLLLILCLLLYKGLQPCETHVKLPAAMMIYPAAVSICLVIFWKICI